MAWRPRDDRGAEHFGFVILSRLEAQPRMAKNLFSLRLN
jgi:hypothetical protein